MTCQGHGGRVLRADHGRWRPLPTVVVRLPVPCQPMPPASERGAQPHVVAIVLTYRRPRLASQVVRGLLEREGFTPAAVVVVVNGEGGLDDELAEQVEVLALPRNIGPAGGFRRGLEWAHEHFAASWYYLCEDDVGLFDLPAPRVARLVAEVDRLGQGGPPVGGVVAYARDLDHRTGVGTPHAPSRSLGFDEVELAAWGASLVSRTVIDQGLLPDASWFFGYEDWDFWLRVRAAGFRVLVDNSTAAATAARTTGEGREQAFLDARPLERLEPWRAYYQARNFFELRRRHGSRAWLRSHLRKSVARFVLARDRRARIAIVHGLLDGVRGVKGKVARYERSSGELAPPGVIVTSSDQSPGSSSGNRSKSSRASEA